MSYQTIVADPPWPYRNVAGPHATPEHRPNSFKSSVGSALQYGSMTIAELKALDVKGVTAEMAHLYLWTTNSFVVEAHEVAQAWGFCPKTLITWGKIKTNGTPSMKTGYYYRGATEHCLFAVKGSLKLAGKASPTLRLSQRLPHSVKPEWFYQMVEEQSPAPRLEMFARKTRNGWDSWGNECESIKLFEVRHAVG